MSFAEDFAALAALDREHIPALDSLIPAERPAPARSLLDLADAYVLRRAGNAWATVLTGCVACFVVYNFPIPPSRLHDALCLERYFNGWSVVMTMLAAASLAAHVARRRAERRFSTAMAGSAAPLDTAARLLAPGETASLALAIAGATCFATYFTVMLVFAEGQLFWIPTPDAFESPSELASVFYNYWNGLERLHDLRIAMPILALCAIGVAWVRCAVLVRLRRPAAAIAVVGAVVLWFHESWMFNRWWGFSALTTGERTVVTFAFAAVVFIAVAGFVLHGRESSSSRARGASAGSSNNGAR